MNIGFFSETYSPDINGVVTSMNSFRDELGRLGHNVYVFAPGEELFSWPGKRRRRTKVVYRFSSFKYPLYKSLRVAIPFSWSVQRTIPRLKLDIVHSHTPFSMGLFAGGVSWRQRLPHVHTYHTLYPEYVKFYWPGFKRWNQKSAERLSAMFCNRVTEVIAPSDGIKHKLRGYGINTPITTLPTGIDRSFFETRGPGHEIRRRYHIPLDAPLVITVARLGREKSVDHLLHSFKHLLGFRSDAWYLIVGDGPARLELETLARELGIAARVVFTGFMTKKVDVIKAYSTADTFIFASQTDTQCLTLLEGAATGLPLVARYDKPLETALHDEKNGLFVRGEDPHKFAWKLHKVLDDKSVARRYGKESVKIARGQSAEKRAQELVALYEKAQTDYSGPA